MQIREATIEDLHPLVRMCAQFCAESPHQTVTGAPDAHALIVSIRAMLIDGENFRVLLAQRADGSLAGFLIGAVSTLWWDKSKRLASELAWWVEPSARRGRAGMALLWRWLENARDAGCEFAALSTLDGVGTQALPSRLGFVACETGWLVRLAGD